MARGALVDNGTVIAITEAAEGLDLHYQTDAAGAWVAFVPDAYAQVGDGWNGTAFTYLQTPQTVTMLQARLALDQTGLAAAVAAVIATQPQATQDYWNFSQSVNRNNPIVVNLGAALGLTTAQIDDLFRAAAAIVPT